MYSNGTKIILCFLFLTACSDTSSDSIKDDVEMVKTEPQSNEETEETTEEDIVEEVLVEPTGIMEDWGAYTPEEKIAKVEECITYVLLSKEENNTPVKVLGTTNEFVKVIDDRYEEIQGLTGSDGFEKMRMNSSPIATQVDIMGATHKLFKFAY